MTRSKWKIPYTDKSLLDFSTKKNTITVVYSRNSTILPEFINNIFLVYNGIRFFKIKVKKDMIGHKFGEYAFTRKKTVIKKKKKKKRKNDKIYLEM